MAGTAALHRCRRSRATRSSKSGQTGPLTLVVLVLAVASLFLLGLGIFGLVASHRFRRRLQAHPWRAWPVEMSVTGGGPTYVLDPGDGGEAAVLVAATNRQRWQVADTCAHGGILWLAGDPRSGGVASLAGGSRLFWVATPMTRRGAKRLGRHVGAAGNQSSDRAALNR
jgi:hypothetical protein